MTDLDLDAIIDQHRPRSGTNHRCRVCKEWAPCTTSQLAARLAEVERERDAAREQSMGLALRLAAVRKLHPRGSWLMQPSGKMSPWCWTCSEPWPCPTIRALDAEVTDR